MSAVRSRPAKYESSCDLLPCSNIPTAFCPYNLSDVPAKVCHRAICWGEGCSALSSARTTKIVCVSQNDRKILRKMPRISAVPACAFGKTVNVARAPNCLDVLPGTSLIAQFLAELAHVHVDAAVIRRKCASQGSPYQFLAADHAPGVP